MAVNGSKGQRAPRFRRRVTVAFGTAYPLPSTGFSTNISVRGLAMTSASIYPPGTRVFLEVRGVAPRPVRAEGLVAWAKRGSQPLGIPNALGVRLEGADEEWFQLIHEALAGGDERPRPPPAPLSARAEPPGPPKVVIPPVHLAPTPARPASPRAAAPGIDHATGAARLRRFEAAIPLSFGPDAALRFRGCVHNLSATGFAFRSTEALAVGTRFFFLVDLGGGSSARGEAKVVWQRDAGHEFDLGARLAGVDESWYRLVMRLSA